MAFISTRFNVGDIVYHYKKDEDSVQRLRVTKAIAVLAGKTDNMASIIYQCCGATNLAVFAEVDENELSSSFYAFPLGISPAPAIEGAATEVA